MLQLPLCSHIPKMLLIGSCRYLQWLLQFVECKECSKWNLKKIKLLKFIVPITFFNLLTMMYHTFAPVVVMSNIMNLKM